MVERNAEHACAHHFDLGKPVQATIQVQGFSAGEGINQGLLAAPHLYRLADPVDAVRRYEGGGKGIGKLLQGLLIHAQPVPDKYILSSLHGKVFRKAKVLLPQAVGKHQGNRARLR